jgi:tryptophanyl-tRNA synthetase
MTAALAPMRERAAELAAAPARVDQALADGAARARAVAGGTMREVRRRMGFLPPAGG